MKLVPAVIMLLLVLFAPARADDEGKPRQKPAASIAELDARIAKALADARIPGASIAVIENNTIVLAKGYGVSDLKASTPVTTETIFRAGSISKSLTSIGIMMLVEEGKLSLDDKLTDLMPELRIDNPWEATNPVRLVHLLEHTAGFNDIEFSRYLLEGANVPLAKAAELYGPYRSRWKPGTRMSYANGGPVIAGRIIEKASGQAFETFMASRLTGPLGMQSAAWTRTPAVVPRLSKSYRDEMGNEAKFFEIVGRPSGSLNVTARDLARIPLMLLARGTLDGQTYLASASIDRIERTGTTRGAEAGLTQAYGLGNMAIHSGKVVFRGHDGAIDGFLAKYAYAPGHGMGYVVMGNLANPELFNAAREIRRYLERNLKELAPAPRPLAAQDLVDFPGFYGPITPRQEKLAVLTSLAWRHVEASDGKLSIGGQPAVHVGNGLFQTKGAAAPDLVITRTDEGIELYEGLGAERRLPDWQVIVTVTFLVAFVAVLFVNLVFMPFWLWGILTGRLAERGGLSIRLVPALAMLAVVAGCFTLLLILASNDVDLLGKPSTGGWLLYALTLAIPTLGAATLVRSAMGAPNANLFVRLLAWANGLIVVTVAGHLWTYGWIGMKIWE
jgi:CubicO group peptidase (beta-lactamase class C family)